MIVAFGSWMSSGFVVAETAVWAQTGHWRIDYMARLVGRLVVGETNIVRSDGQICCSSCSTFVQIGRSMGCCCCFANFVHVVANSGFEVGSSGCYCFSNFFDYFSNSADYCYRYAIVANYFLEDQSFCSSSDDFCCCCYCCSCYYCCCFGYCFG